MMSVLVEAISWCVCLPAMPWSGPAVQENLALTPPLPTMASRHISHPHIVSLTERAFHLWSQISFMFPT